MEAIDPPPPCPHLTVPTALKIVHTTRHQQKTADDTIFYLERTIHFLSDRQMFSLKLKLVYSEKATKFYEISTLLLSTVHTDKSKVEISQNFVAFSEYMNFNQNS